jgi:hypothetical protein
MLRDVFVHHHSSSPLRHSLLTFQKAAKALQIRITAENLMDDGPQMNISGARVSYPLCSFLFVSPFYDAPRHRHKRGCIRELQ